MERKNNYDRAAREAETLFLQYDQQSLLRSFGLESDESYLYVDFVSRGYRINRRTGVMERRETAPTHRWRRAEFAEVLSIFDCLCYSGNPPVPTGTWKLTGSLRREANGPSELLDRNRAGKLAKDLSKTAAACLALGGKKIPGGDLCYELPIFAGFSTRLQLWLPDDEFPAQVQFFWDGNALQFVHYETIFYMMDHVLNRLEEEMGQV